MRHRLRIAREEAGFDQEQLAAEIGVSRRTVLNAERGYVEPLRVVIKAWALACGVRLSWLVTGDDGFPDTPPSKDKPPRNPRGGDTGDTRKPVGLPVTVSRLPVRLPVVNRAA